jgi:outer membrane protein assembly factor BamA
MRFLFFFLAFANLLYAQDSPPAPRLHLSIIGSDKPDFLSSQKWTAPLSYSTLHRDTASLLRYADTILIQLQRKGFWAASIDSVTWQKDSCKIQFFVGDVYKFNKILNGNIDGVTLDEIGFRPNMYEQQVISPKTVNGLKEKIVQWAENHGYPFCSVWLAVETDTPTKGEVTGRLFWKKGNRFILEKPKIEGNARVSERFLEQYLDITHGTPYNEATIQKLRKRIAELPFIEEKQAFSVDFIQERNINKARPHFFLKRKRASRFDVLVGFLPATEPGKPLNVTGNAELEFLNLFGGGQQLRFQWTQVRDESPEAKFFIKLPYVFGLPIGTDANFELYKRDTSYIDVRSEIGVNYQLKANDYVKVFWNTFNTNLLGIDTVTIKATRRLPDVLDVSNNGFGLEYHGENLDYRFCPRKGWSGTIRASVNFKTVRENNKISSLFDENTQNRFNYANLYDSLRNPIAQYRGRVTGNYYMPIGERNVIKIGATGGGIFSSKPLYRNEQFRIGGAKLLRGFSEEALFSNFFAIGTIEYRFLLSQNSYLFGFFDQAYVEDVSIKSRVFDRPSGFGGGLTLETKAGIFGLTIAFGQQQQNGFDFNAAKVHFGYVNLF